MGEALVMAGKALLVQLRRQRVLAIKDAKEKNLHKVGYDVSIYGCTTSKFVIALNYNLI